MFDHQLLDRIDKPTFYRELHGQLAGLLQGERDAIANMANTSALLFHQMPALNWAGFYLMRDGELVLGPFQGKPACVRIAVGRGVCGTAVTRQATMLVPDVHAFPGHIACDAASRSELVIPMMRDGVVLGVLDLDSPDLARFDEVDQRELERVTALLIEASDWAATPWRP